MFTAILGRDRAGLDARGRIVMVQQDAFKKGEPTDVELSQQSLEQSASELMTRLGWDSPTLAAENLKLESSVPTEQGGGPELLMEWAGYTSQGINNDGWIRLCLDRRDAHLTSFFYDEGVGDVKVDLNSVLTQEAAERVGREYVLSQLPQAGLLELKRANLGWTNASAVTKGQTKLIWNLFFSGPGPDEVTADGTPITTEIGGTVYLDAVAGEVLQFLTF